MSPEEYRWKDIERRVERVEHSGELVSAAVHDIRELRDAVVELRDDQRSLRRALYTSSLSVVSAAVIFAVTANELFR